MRFCWCQISSFKDRSYKFVVEPEHFVAEVAIVMIALRISIKLHGVRDHHLFSKWLKCNEIRLVPIIMILRLRVISRIVEKVRSVRPTHGGICGTIWDRGGCIVGRASARTNAFKLVFQFLDFADNFPQLLLPLILLDGTFRYRKHPLAVDEITCSGSSSKFTIYAFPFLLEVRLNVLESIQRRHLTRLLLLWRQWILWGLALWWRFHAILRLPSRIVIFDWSVQSLLLAWLVIVLGRV